ncbi:sulfotransferase [Hyphomicrobium sp. D-2]|uniref:sulfotransferase family protein n=1 Tax=Hyphomicrobium sp. D-2 TaxID=3041621 RepID=UPI0024579A12|nr:sulfotransferase [Hyphomicrobium sp. D-2]MDH4982529.1 sulfotransferase [Hyphomicrobium sp. D-2]
MLRRRHLSSGVRLGPPLPLRMFNQLGPLVRAAGKWPSIDVDKMMRDIERKYGRDDWPDEIRRALPVRAKAFNEDADLSLFGMLAVRDQFIKSADNALALEDLIAAHPEILEEKIERPLFVLGLARTGTTLLQRLLSMHPGARYLPFWEGYSPFPRKFGKHEGGRDGRHAEAASRLKLLNFVGPEFNKIHPIEVDDPEECYHLFRNHFLVPPGFDFAYVPSFWKWWDASAHEDAYRMHKRQLQALQWLNPNQHWVLKCPNHLSGLKQLLEVYPDARIVNTHRSADKTVPSLCSLAAVTWCMTSDTVDLKKVGEFALNLAESCEAAGREALKIAPPGQVIHVEYNDLVADPVGMAMSIYERFGYDAHSSLRARMSQWLASHPSDKHGRHQYVLEDFGLTPEIIAERLAVKQPAAVNA